jgi:hypothetical protein
VSQVEVDVDSLDELLAGQHVDLMKVVRTNSLNCMSIVTAVLLQSQIMPCCQSLTAVCGRLA